MMIAIPGGIVLALLRLSRSRILSGRQRELHSSSSATCR